MASVCQRCGKEVGFWKSFNFDRKRGRCKECKTEVTKQLKKWRKNFLKACEDGLLTQYEWNQLTNLREHIGLSKEEVLTYVRRDALNFVERTFAFARSDGYLDEEEEATLDWLISELDLASASSHILSEMSHLVALRNIRQGKLKTITPSTILAPDELCYLEVPASYNRVLKSGVKELPGRIVVTNKKVYFIAPSGGGEIPLKKILNVVQHRNGVFLELSRKANNGLYTVTEPDIVGETIMAVVKLANRQLIAPRSTRDTRHIPQHLKTAIWQRDQGKCVECDAVEYLEFDHIIPHSKGGATSLNNLQLLCRRCNMAKGANL